MHIEKLQLFTAEPGSLLTFYRDVLACKVRPFTSGFQVHCGYTELLFSQAPKGAPTYHFAFNIPFHKVAEAQEWARQRVPLMDLGNGNPIADFRNWDAQAFYFFDPAENIVEFIGRKDATAGDDTPFSGSSLLNVSEIGIVTDDVSLTTRQLEEIWQVPLFPKQPPTPNFAAAGNDNGLFIVVKEGRHWYPTQQPAVKAPVMVQFKTDDGCSRLMELDT